MSVVDLSRVRAAFETLDRLLVAHPELRRGGARLAELAELAAVADVDVAGLADVAELAAEEVHKALARHEARHAKR